MEMKLDSSTTPNSEMQMQSVCFALFEAAAEGLVVIDGNGLIVLVNQRMCELLGYTTKELIGSTIEKFVPKRYEHAHQQHRDKYFEAPSRRSMGYGRDLMALRSDGTEFAVEVSLNHFQVEGETFVMALISDITQRKNAERELGKLNQELERRVAERTSQIVESQRLYAIIARNFPNGTIMVFDREFNYIFTEGRELYRMGVTSEELVGTNYLNRLAPRVRDIILPQLLEVFGGQSVNFDIEVDDRYYKLNAVPLQDTDGKISQILVVETNVTQQKRVEHNMVKALEKERELNELKSRFVSMASHEFRTPLSTILTSLSLANRYHGLGNEENLQKHYGRIRSSVHILTAILNDFLSLDKLESGMIGSNPEPLNLKLVIEDLIDEMQAMCKPGQSITFVFEGEAMVTTDQNMLRNIVVNLISNAIKYSNENSVVEVEATVKDSRALVQVRDHGIGIPDADQRHIFERFFRAQNSTNIQGTGLGLNIVKKYLNLLGGDIWFESTPMVGTVFSFVIPQNLVV